MATTFPSFASACTDTSPHLGFHYRVPDPFSRSLHHKDGVIASHGGKGIFPPSFEIRESKEAYFLEGEFTGVNSKDDITVEWTDTRTLSVSAVVQTLDLEKEWGISLSKHTDTTANSSALFPLHDWANERHTGHFLRTFTFPHDVKQETLQARLTQGLLKMMVIKDVSIKEPQRVRIKISDTAA